MQEFGLVLKEKTRKLLQQKQWDVVHSALYWSSFISGNIGGGGGM